MSDLDRVMKELIQAIKESEEYRDYLEAREILSADEEKYRRTNLYRKQCYLFQVRETPMTEITYLTDFREELTEDPEIERFILAENALCRMIQKINYSIVDEIDFEIGF